MVAWGWIGILEKPQNTSAPAPKGSKKIAWRGSDREVFWAAWWTERPSLERWVRPDDLGIIEGQRAWDEAVGAADAAVRKARGNRVYVAGVPREIVERAFSDGTRRRKSKAKDFDKIARDTLASFGLDLKASPVEIRRVYRQRVAEGRLHPDKGGHRGTFEELTRGMEAAVAFVQRHDQTTVADGLLRREREKLVAKVRRIGREVRGRAEAMARTVLTAKSLKDRAGLSSVTLSGFCAVVALGLVEALKAEGVVARMAGDKFDEVGHYWAEVPLPDPGGGVDPGSIFVDLTVTQFSKRWPDCLVTLPEDKRRRHYTRRAGGAFVSNWAANMPSMSEVKPPKDWWKA